MSLLSSKQLSKEPGHFIHTESGKPTIAFPTFVTNTNDTNEDNLIFLHIHESQPPQAHHNTSDIDRPTVISQPEESSELVNTSETTADPQTETVDKDPHDNPSEFQKLMQNIITASNPLPYWHKTKMKVTLICKY